jgi:hypothetical protein
LHGSDRDKSHGNRPIEAHRGIALERLAPQHEAADDDHQDCEQEEELVARNRLTKARAEERARDPCGREDDGAWPLHRAGTGVMREIGKGVDGHRQGLVPMAMCGSDTPTT